MSADSIQGLSARSPTQDAPGAYPPSPRPSSVQEAISGPRSLSAAVKARQSEYVQKKTIKVKVGTWNTAALAGTEADIGAWFVGGKGIRGLKENLSGSSESNDAEDGKIESVNDQEARMAKGQATVPKQDVPAEPSDDEIDMYILGLQEIVDINSPSEALRPYSDPGPGKKWKSALESSLPSGYSLVAEQQMSGLLLLVYGSPDVAQSISSVSTTSVGTGLMGYMRNKGAVCARFVLGEATRFALVNCHLAAGSDQAARDRRNWDASQILSRAKFEPIDDGLGGVEEYGHALGDEDIAFWFGDLNYRLADIPGEDVRRLLLLHTRNEYDLNNKSKRKIDSELGYVSADQTTSPPELDGTSESSTEPKESPGDEVDGLPLSPQSDPASLHTTLQSLLPHDQLRDQKKNYKAFHDGWREGDIDFLPTYKYDIGSVGMFDSGDKKRGPSWCDRILYRTRQDRRDAEKKREEEEAARKRDAEMRERGLDESDDVIFDSDPGTPGFPGTPGYAPDDEYDEDDDAASESELAPGRDSSEGGAIVLEHYGSHQRVLSSDHKPLDAVFVVTYDAVVPELKSKIHQEVARELDKQENEERPAVTVVVDNPPNASGNRADGSAERVDPNGIDFGEVRYGVLRSAGLTIANTSGVPTTFLFVDRPTDVLEKSGIAPKWLHLSVDGASNNFNSNRNALLEYTLSPGESRQVHLSVCVDEFKMTRRLNAGVIRLDDVLVLRVKDGRDYFVSLTGIWMQSCLCRTLDELLLVPEGGVRSLSTPPASGKDESVAEAPQQQRLSAPRELFALTEAIQNLAQKAIAGWEMLYGDGESEPPWKEGALGAHGWPFDSRSWSLKPSPERSELLTATLEALDTGVPLNTHLVEEISTLHHVEVLAETLLTFLTSLQDGIVTLELWTQLEASMAKRSGGGSDEDEEALVLETLSSAPVHSVSFTFVTFMLASIASDMAAIQQSARTKSTTTSPRVSTSSARSSEHHQHPETSVLSPSFSAISPTSPVTPATATSDPTTPMTPRFANIPHRTGIPFPSISSFRRSRTRTDASTTSTDDSQAQDTKAQDAARAREKESRDAVTHAYADIFAEALVRTGKSAIKDKDRRKMRAVILPFLRSGS